MGTYFQLFKTYPDKEFVDKLVRLYGINDYDENYTFTKDDLEKKGIVEKLEDLKEDFAKYYMGCKYRKYAEDMTVKKSITLLRQFLRVVGYKVITREKYSNGRKFLVYNLKKSNTNGSVNFVISFE